jgi:hypothetical protein
MVVNLTLKINDLDRQINIREIPLTSKKSEKRAQRDLKTAKDYYLQFVKE